MERRSCCVRRECGAARDAATGSPDRVLLNDGTGRFTEVPNAFPARRPGFDSGHLMKSADFDGDGWPDLLFVIFKVGTDIYDRLRLLLNNRDGTFRDASAGIPHPGRNVRYTGVNWPAVADFNGDGMMDIIVTAGLARPWLFLNTGNARFIDASELLPMELPSTWPIAGDLNGDGKVDVFATEAPLSTSSPTASPIPSRGSSPKTSRSRRSTRARQRRESRGDGSA